jgi:hypothetical protein
MITEVNSTIPIYVKFGDWGGRASIIHVREITFREYIETAGR